MVFLFLIVVLEVFVGIYIFYARGRTLNDRVEVIFKDVLTRYDDEKAERAFVDAVQRKVRSKNEQNIRDNMRNVNILI